VLEDLSRLDFLPQTPNLENQLLSTLIGELGSEDSWRKFLDPEDPVDWIHEHFRIPETPDHRFILQPYQRRMMREAFSKDENGLFKYATVVWSDCKKSVKSTVAAAMLLYRAWHTPWGQFTVVANDLKGADARVGFYLRRAIELHPEMKAVCKIVNYKTTLPNRAYIESVPIDPSGEAGGNADMVVFSELWGAHQEAQRRMWTEATIPPNKHGKSQRLIETYAGFSGESILLEQLYETGVKKGERLEWAGEFDPPLEVFRNESAQMLCMWNTTPRMPWQSESYYRAESAVLTPNEFLRVHRNQWVSSSSAFVPLEWWVACKSPAPLPPLDPNEPVIAAVDAAIEGDCFAIVLISGWTGDKYAVRYARAWYPPRGDRIHFRTTAGDGPEDELRRLVDQYNVIEIAFDPYQLKDLSERFTSEMIANMTEFDQQGPRAKADKQLYDMIRDRSIIHSGEQDLQEHIANANSKSEGENKLRIVKRSQLLKIDLAVCVSMGVDRARSYNLASMH
jgi:phage terminase large subunit-like protein